MLISFSCDSNIFLYSLWRSPAIPLFVYNLFKLRLLKIIIFQIAILMQPSCFHATIFHHYPLLFFQFSTLSLSKCLENTKCSILFFCLLLLLIFSCSQLLPPCTSTASCSQTAQSSPHLCGGARLCPHQAHQSAICLWVRYRSRRRCFILSVARSHPSIHTPVAMLLLVILPLSFHVIFCLPFFSPASWQSEWRPPKSQAPLAQPALSPKFLHLSANDPGQPAVLRKKTRIELPCNAAPPLTYLMPGILCVLT